MSALLRVPDIAKTIAMHPTSILQVSHNYFVAGGSDRYFLDLSRLLEQHGHTVIPFCAKSDRDLSTSYAKYFPRTIDTQSPSIADLGRYLFSRQAREKIGIVADEYLPSIAHMHIYYGKLTASILKPLKERGIPIVQTLHEYKLLCPVYDCISNGSVCEACGGRSFWHCTVGRCNRGSLARSVASSAESYVSKWLGSVDGIDKFIGPSQFMVDKMQQIGIPAEKLVTVHNFVDADRFEPAIGGGGYALYFGRLERTKGLVYFAASHGIDSNCTL